LPLIDQIALCVSLKLQNAANARARAILERRATEVERLARQLLKQRRIKAS
jgi:hypothetical protein